MRSHDTVLPNPEKLKPPLLLPGGGRPERETGKGNEERGRNTGGGFKSGIITPEGGKATCYAFYPDPECSYAHPLHVSIIMYTTRVKCEGDMDQEGDI